MTHPNLLKADFCVIGAGSGGLSFAAGAAQMGASVVLLEKKHMGGDCLNDGCIPSKALIHQADLAHISGIQPDFQAVHDYVQSVIQKIAPHDSIERFESLGVQVIQEAGQFIDNQTVRTDHHIIKAKRYIIATGSSPFIPPIPGMESVPYYTNESIFNLNVLPKHLAIIGGGPIGMELAQAFCRLGSTVTVLEASLAFPKDDPEMTAPLKSLLKKEGIIIEEQANISHIKQDDASIHIQFTDAEQKIQTVRCTHLLVAAGRRANINALGLSDANIKTTARGIVVDRFLKTSNPRVFAIGDCTGGYQFTHVAGYHAGLAIRNSLFRLRSPLETRAIPWVTFTSPELAHVGYLESQLISSNIPYQALRLPFEAIDRAQTDSETVGSIKVLVSKKGKILGATMLGAQAGELIYPWVMAIQQDMKISAFASTLVPYPTRNDISKQVAGSFYKDTIFSPWMRRVVKLIMRLTR